MRAENGGCEGAGGDNISGTQNKFKLYIDIYVYIWYNIYGVVCCPTATSVFHSGLRCLAAETSVYRPTVGGDVLDAPRVAM